MRKGNKIFKHQLVITSILVLAVVVSIIGGSFAIFSSKSTSGEYNVLKSGDLEISYVDTGSGYGDILSLNGSYPISDSEGLSGSYYRFSVENRGDVALNYRIKIEDDEAIINEDGCSNNLLDHSNIKFFFGSNPDPSTDTGTVLGDVTNNVVYVSSTPLLPGNQQIHEIRLWIKSDAPNSVLGKHFHGKVVVESVQQGVEFKMLDTYNIGDSVTLVDGSHWHVLENSGNTTTMVKLLSDYNLNSDGTYCTSGSCATLAFDTANTRLTSNNSYCTTPENGCNFYEKNGSTVISDSTIKTWLETNYKPKIISSLTSATGGSTEDLTVSIPSVEEIALADSQNFNQAVLNLTDSKNYLATTSYWTKTAHNNSSSQVWYVNSNKTTQLQQANNDATVGIRPVIKVSKVNITTGS